MIEMPVYNTKGEIIGHIEKDKGIYFANLKTYKVHTFNMLDGCGIDARIIGLLQYHRVHTLKFPIRKEHRTFLYCISLQDFLDNRTEICFDSKRPDGTIIKYGKQFVCPLSKMEVIE